MPLGLWSPSFSYKDLADQFENIIASLPTFKKAAAAYAFKTWDEVCASWLEDVKSEA